MRLGMRLVKRGTRCGRRDWDGEIEMASSGRGTEHAHASWTHGRMHFCRLERFSGICRVEPPQGTVRHISGLLAGMTYRVYGRDMNAQCRAWQCSQHCECGRFRTRVSCMLEAQGTQQMKMFTHAGCLCNMQLAGYVTISSVLHTLQCWPSWGRSEMSLKAWTSVEGWR